MQVGRPPNPPPGYRAEVLGEVDSTSEEARRRAEAGDPGDLWIMARRQSAGRGRLGRSWESGEGDLMCTLLMRPTIPTENWGLYSFAAALALRDALLDDVVAVRLTLKWPNDLLLDGAKLAGILLEGERNWLSVGIGVNLKNRPKDAHYPATSLLEGAYVARDPESLLERLMAAFARRRMALDKTGFDDTRREWLAAATGVGGRIKVRLGKETVSGRFAGIDAHGALILELAAGGTRKIVAGDVFYLT